MVNQKNKVFTIEQNDDNTYTATIKVYSLENKSNEIQNLTKDGEKIKEENYPILVQSQIDLNPEDIVVLKLFAQVYLL